MKEEEYVWLSTFSGFDFESEMKIFFNKLHQLFLFAIEDSLTPSNENKFIYGKR